MTAFAIAVLVLGFVLLAVEAHVPTAGVIGGAGVLALVAGAGLSASAAGAPASAALAVAAAVGALTAVALIATVRRVSAARRRLPRGGASGLVGHVGVARSWRGDDGRVFVDGALWRARLDLPDGEHRIEDGDPVVVDHVHGLTLAVHRADEWEVPS